MEFTEFKWTFIFHDGSHYTTFITTDFQDFTDEWGNVKDEVSEQVAQMAIEQAERNHGFIIKQWNDYSIEVNDTFNQAPHVAKKID